MPCRDGGSRSRLLILLVWFSCSIRVADALWSRSSPAWTETGSQVRTERFKVGTLVKEGVASAQEAKRLLDTAPLSCVLFDQATRTAHFRVAPWDLYDPAELTHGSPNASGPAAFRNTKGWHCRTTSSAPVALMVATWPRHQKYYNMLVASVRKYITGNSTPFISVFSSIEDSTSMTASCDACRSGPEVQMRSLVFNYPYTHRNRNLLRTIYQSAKKLWAIAHVDHERVLMVDSDFSILQPVVLAEAIAPYEHVLYEVPIGRFDGGIFRNMMAHFKELYQMSAPLDVVPMEPPWIYEHGHVNGLLAFIEQATGRGFVDYMLSEDRRLMEVLMYRVFVLAKDPEFFSKRITTTKFWFEDSESVESERLAINPPPVVVRHWQQNSGQPCSICWLAAHADRGKTD